MADVLDHPYKKELAEEKAWDFPDGSSVLIKAGEGHNLTVSQAVYMLEDVKHRIMLMMHDESR